MSEPTRFNGITSRDVFAAFAAFVTIFALTIAIGSMVTLADRPRRVVDRFKEIEAVMRTGLPPEQQEAAVAVILSRTEAPR